MSESAEKNRAFFSNEASTYNSKHEKVMNQIMAEIQARKDWIGVDWADDTNSDDDEAAEDGSTSKPASRSVRLLDYACGTGLVSRALSPYVTQCIGLDISENMVQEYNLSASNQGIPPAEMHAYTGNLLQPSTPPTPAPLPFPSAEFHNFDIAVVGLGFHHFDDPPLAAARLAERLRPGGVLLIIDFLPHARHAADQHAAAHTVMHAGFGEEKVREMFVKAGVGSGFEFVTVGKGAVFSNHKGEDMKRSVFMARGVKGGAAAGGGGEAL